MNLDKNVVAHKRANLKSQLDIMYRKVHILMGLVIMLAILLIAALVFIVTSVVAFKQVIGDVVYTNMNQALIRYQTEIQ